MKYFVLVFIIISLGLAAKIVRAPEIQVVDKVEAEALSKIPDRQSNSIDHPFPRIIDTIPDLSSTARTEGKNIILAEDGQNVAVIYGRLSGQPDNIMRLYLAYSTDLGNNWIYNPLDTNSCRRTYSALDAKPDWTNPLDLNVHFAWHRATRSGGSYDSSPAFYAQETEYPNGLITLPIRLPGGGIPPAIWGPCIGIQDSLVIITAYLDYLTNEVCGIWRSTDYGATWDTARIFLLDAGLGGPHFRFGVDGYIFCLYLGQDELPYYRESFDYGLTWTDPQLIWQNNPPYPNMTNVTCWTHGYDCEVVQDVPVATIKLSSASYEYGEIWSYRPISGGPGNWVFNGTRLVGADSTDPGTYARYPSIAADDNGNTYIGYQAIFATPTDTGPDIGLFVRPSNQDTWIDYGRCTFNCSDIEERFLELAHNAPIVGDSVIIGMIYSNAGSYPTAGYLYFDHYKIPRPGIQEITSKLASRLDVEVKPNPFSTQLTFSYPKSNTVSLEVFDVRGRAVYKIDRAGQSHSINWKGRDLNNITLPSGVYFYKLNTNNNSATGKVIKNR